LTDRTRRYRLDLAYDGTEFAGWQVQPGARTVQGTLEAVLGRLQGGAPVRVRGAGRTDAGVHARGQVADFLLDCRLNEGELEHALRGMLPEEIRPLRIRGVPKGFNAREDALHKSYRYRIDRSLTGDPFIARYALHHPHELDKAALGKALAILQGRKNWTGFTGSACRIDNRVREMFEARYDEGPGSEGWFTFTADGFLTHMVRNIVGTLLEIAGGRLGANRIEVVLDSGDRRLAGPTVAARGLFLWRVKYPGDEAGHGESA
jgi:tRNA pseudouridine38-40 synthase